MLGCVPWDAELIAPRVMDLANYLDAGILNSGDMEFRRLRSITFCARTVGNILGRVRPGVLLVTPGDRSDVLVAASLVRDERYKIRCYSISPVALVQNLQF